MIYCRKTEFGQISRSFSLNSGAIRLKRPKNLTQIGFPSLRSVKSDRLLAAKFQPGVHGGTPDAKTLVRIEVNGNAFQQVAIVIGVVEFPAEFLAAYQVGVFCGDASRDDQLFNRMH